MVNRITAKNIKDTTDQKKLKHLYLAAFPKEERLPWWVLRAWNALGWGALTAYYQEDVFCGFAFSATTDRVHYVMFFAVEEGLRGRGCGSRILSHMTRLGKPVLLNVELLDQAAPNYPQRLQRMAFYQKNGFRDTGFHIREVGGVFGVLSSTGWMDMSAYQAAFQKLSLGLWKPKIFKPEDAK